MKFVIEPAQTYWSFANSERTIANCTLRSPEGTEVLGIELNHLVCKYPTSTPAPPSKLEFVAVQLGVAAPETVLLHAEYVGILQLGERLTHYAVFMQNAKPLEIKGSLEVPAAEGSVGSAEPAQPS